MSDVSAAVSIADLKEKLKGFENLVVVHGATYKDCSTILIVPTRGRPIIDDEGRDVLDKKDRPVSVRSKVGDPILSPRFVTGLQGLMPPMNQVRTLFFSVGHEVGQAYSQTIAQILASPLRSYKYILTLEDDNIPPPDGHIRLLEAIDETGFDGMGGLYFTKGYVNEPMAYGDPEIFRREGVLDFRPRDVREAVKKGQIMEVNGVAMGFTLWKMSLFTDIEGPWFVTNPEGDAGYKSGQTQDLAFCQRARRAGKRFGVDCRVRVSHWDNRLEEAF